jgi:hypothetical protein
MTALEPFVIGLAARGFVLFVLGFGAALLLRRSPGELQRRAWLLVFVGAGTLPLLMLAVPGWEILPAAPTSATAGSLTPEGEGRGPVSSGLLDPAAGPGFGEGAPAWAWFPEADGVAGHGPGSAGGGGDAGAPVAVVVLMGAWMGGAGFVLLWAGVGVGRLAGVRRRARPVRDPARLEELSALASRVGVDARRIQLLVSDEMGSPATWGIARPVILLPSSMADAPARLRATVLLHELLHVRQRSWAIQLLALAVCALHWFNPLSWLARRRFVAAEERMVDEGVVAAGVSRREYASRLVEIVRSLQSGRREAAAAVRFGRRSTLEDRVRSLLRGAGSPSVPSRPVLAGVSIAVVLGVMGVAVAEGRSPEPAGLQEPVAISPDPLLQVGTATGDPDQEFHQVITPFLLSGGRLAVPVAGERTIRVFGPEGTLVSSHGRPGEGPGEFQALSSAWARGDTIEAFDGQLQRLTRFLPDGSVQVVTPEFTGSAGLAVPMPLHDGWAFVGIGSSGSGERDELVIHRHGGDGSHLGEVTRTLGIGRVSYPTGGSGPDPLSPRGLVAVRNGRIYVAETLTPEIQVFDASGRREAPLAWDPEPAAPPAEALRILRDSASARRAAGDASGMAEIILDAAIEMPAPHRISVFWSFLVDEEGFVWVRPYDPASHAVALGGLGQGAYTLGAAGAGPGGRWRVFSPEGVEVGSMFVPEGLELWQVQSNAVVGVHRDPLGVESVRVHALERRPRTP